MYNLLICLVTERTYFSLVAGSLMLEQNCKLIDYFDRSRFHRSLSDELLAGDSELALTS